MKNESKRQGVIKSLCLYLGRQNIASDFLDYISSWLFLQPAFAFSGNGKFPLPKYKEKTEEKLAKSKPVMMARPTAPHNGMDGRAAPTTGGAHRGALRSEEVSPWRVIFGLPGIIWHLVEKDKAGKHKTAPCSDPKYRGMHGQPCKFAGGSDTKCPSGTTSGWFWSYEVPSFGRIYYVDCCGAGGSASDVWCEWTSEPDWCNGWGRAANNGISGYNCTLAILEVDMNVVDLAGGKYEVRGVDP
ncbi:MAG: hypothetical protein ACR2MG_01820 [Pyrinomonadaceae bacterium]